MQPLKLYMLLLGCKPKGRHTEQHDIFFCVGTSFEDLEPQILEFWPDGGKIHVDAWREVTQVDGYRISIVPHAEVNHDETKLALFFLNLGGYRENEFDEFHYKMLLVYGNKAEAIQEAKQTAFFKHTCFDGAESHIDDKYGVDVDDVYQIEDILSAATKEKYSIQIQPTNDETEDELHLGYFKLSNLVKKQ